MKFLIHLVAKSEAGQHMQEIAGLERKRQKFSVDGLPVDIRVEVGERSTKGTV